MMGPGRPAKECENDELVAEFEQACRGGDYEFAEEYRDELLRRLTVNNQVKLIDADKLLKWIEEDKGAEGFWGEGEMVHQATCSFDNLTDAINEGKFDPDTTPVPTIKPGDKVRHPYYDEGIVKVYDLNGDGRALVAFEDPDCGERLILHRDLEVVE